MINTTQSPHTNEQITAWLRGLLTIAWADGHYDDEERALIAELTKELALSDTEVLFKSIEPEELAAALGPNKKIAENFLRTAVLARSQMESTQPPKQNYCIGSATLSDLKSKPYKP